MTQVKKIVLVGYGKIGHAIEVLLPQERYRIVGRVHSNQELEQFQRTDHCIAIDFSTPQGLLEHYQDLATRFTGVIVGTTGWQAQRAAVLDCFSQAHTPMIYGNNFSLGVYIYLKLARLASHWSAQLLATSDPYLLEMHHCHKLDRPSGTATQLAQIIQQAYPQRPLEIASLRVAELKGIHEIGFVTADERIRMIHETFSRRTFAAGVWYAVDLLETVSQPIAFDQLLDRQLANSAGTMAPER